MVSFERDIFTRRRFLAGAGSLLILGATACGNNNQEENASSQDTLTIQHKFGSTETPENPERIVAVGFNEADFVLALGIVPVGVRDSIGTYDEQRRPWAQEALGGEQPELVGGNEINLEKVAALEPDLILGIYSFMTQENYDLLAEIAPTVAQPSKYADGGTPWQEQMLITGRALGEEAEAERVVADVEGRFDKAREQHPEFEEKTAAIVLTLESENYLLSADDLRTQLFTSLGFGLPEESGPVSRESVDLLDQDVLVFLGATPESIESDELIQSTTAAEEGRIVTFGDYSTDFSGAIGFSSPLSLPLALDEAVPKLAAAIDGDPATNA